MKTTTARAVKRARATRNPNAQGTFIVGSWSEKRTQVEGEVGFGPNVDDFTMIRVELSNTYQEEFKDCVWLRITRKGPRRAAEQWETEHSTQIVVRSDELDVLLDTLTEAVRHARADGVVPGPLSQGVKHLRKLA